jgi:Ca-activated chloride channel family protein
MHKIKHYGSKFILVLYTPATSWSSMILAWACSLSTILLASTALSQSDNIRVAPRQKELVESKNTFDSSSLPDSRLLKVDVNLVLVPVTVTDEMNRVVLGLEKENFQVYENKQLQSIQSFSSMDVPVSIGIIFDTSGSMVTKIDRAREAIGELIETANPQDEFFLITFADQPIDLADFTTSPEELMSDLIFARPKGLTALLDAVYLGLAKMHSARYTKKALLIISDGGDNHSRYSEKDLKRLVKESDVMIYAIGIYDNYFRTVEEQLGPELLSDISELSGGRSFTVDNPNDLPDIAGKIGVELRNQYVLGYRPNEGVADSKWHNIRIKLLPPKGLPRLQVSAKQGYYARGD